MSRMKIISPTMPHGKIPYVTFANTCCDFSTNGDSRVITEEMREGQDPNKKDSSLTLFPWLTQNCTLNWSSVAYYYG